MNDKSIPPLIKDPRYPEFVRRYASDIHRFAKEVCGLELTWQQVQIAQSVQEFGSRTTISSGHGCFGKGTPVMLANGKIKCVENITTEDELMGDDGTPRQVLALCRGRENLYKFTYADGSGHIFNESHILCLAKREKNQPISYFTLDVRAWLALPEAKRANLYIYRKYKDKPMTFFSIKAVECLGVGDYYGFELDGNHQFLGGDFTVLHNTGKTAIYGVLVLWHLTCFHHSITAVIAPKIEQVRKQVFKEVALSLNRMKKNDFAWVAEQVELNVLDLNIKGAKQYWHVLGKTAPKNEPENLAGLHGDYLLVIADEASGIEDTHFGVLTGSLTDKRNRMVLASQPTRNVGFFYDTHHRLSQAFGGRWRNLTLNSEESPIVSVEFLQEKQLQYSREQYDIKVRGQFPNKSDGFLLGRSEIDAIFGYNPLAGADYQDWGYVFPIDVGGGDFRDDSVLTVARVWGFGLFGENARRVYIEQMPIVRDDINTVELARKVNGLVNQFDSPTVAVDYGGMGVSFIHQLEDLGVSNIIKVKWGNPCFSKAYRDSFTNLRAQAIVAMARAIQEKRFGISEEVADRYGSRIINELTRLPYDYDNKARYQIMSKPDMKTKGIPSPDIADTFAFTFLEGVHYIACEKQESEKRLLSHEQAIAQNFADLDAFFAKNDES